MGHYAPRTKTPIDVHIDNLIEMCIISRRSKSKQQSVRRILEHCKDEYEMSRKLHDVWCGNKTIEQFIAQYEEELMLC